MGFCKRVHSQPLCTSWPAAVPCCMQCRQGSTRHTYDTTHCQLQHKCIAASHEGHSKLGLHGVVRRTSSPVTA